MRTSLYHFVQEMFAYLHVNLKVNRSVYGNKVLISKGYSSACRYSMLLRYMSLASLNTESDGFIWRLEKTKL